MSLRLSRDSMALDAAAAAVFAAFAFVDALGAGPRTGPAWANLALGLAVAAAVLGRRRHPLGAAYGFLALLVLSALALTSPEDLSLPLFGLVLFPYAVAGRARGAWAIAWLPCCMAAIVLVSAANDSGLGFSDVAFPAMIAIAAWLAGRGSRGRAELAAELHEAALRAEEEREHEARRAVAAERRRIARELHDVVAHSISVMVVQAGGARRILERDPERAEAAAAQIERTGREALLEMRRLLGVLRGPDQAAELAPSPTFEGLGALVGRARAAGLPVEVDVEGEPRLLPAGVDLTAYRVVQEALTNALQHAPGARTSISVVWHADALELVIADCGPGPAPGRASGGPGQGLIGMRERVALYGGDLRTGPRRGGGFEVRVRLPLEASSIPASATAVVQGAA
jgi:signal transduction histidine kinase